MSWYLRCSLGGQPRRVAGIPTASRRRPKTVNRSDEDPRAARRRSQSREPILTAPPASRWIVGRADRPTSDVEVQDLVSRNGAVHLSRLAGGHSLRSVRRARFLFDPPRSDGGFPLPAYETPMRWRGYPPDPAKFFIELSQASKFENGPIQANDRYRHRSSRFEFDEVPWKIDESARPRVIERNEARSIERGATNLVWNDS